MHENRRRRSRKGWRDVRLQSEPLRTGAGQKQTGKFMSGNDSAAGVKSVQQAVRILEAVAQISGPAQLKDIAARAGVAPSKAHRYLQSLCESGFVSQLTKSGAYDLGVNALRLGLAAVSRVDIVNRAGDALLELVGETDADAFLSVWGEAGPIMVRFERSRRPTAAMMGAGVSMPALTSATRQVFLAFGAPERTRLAVEREAGDDWRRALKETNVMLARVRAAGYACSTGLIMPGRQCIAAPIISFDDNVMAAVSLVSMNKSIVEPDGPSVQALSEFCKRHSVRKRGYVETTTIEERIAV